MKTRVRMMPRGKKDFPFVKVASIVSICNAESVNV
jgi:hypothetical protein